MKSEASGNAAIVNATSIRFMAGMLSQKEKSPAHLSAHGASRILNS
jgi:hypothetical protein